MSRRDCSVRSDEGRYWISEGMKGENESEQLQDVKPVESGQVGAAVEVIKKVSVEWVGESKSNHVERSRT
jgi:hypothetical protein